MRGYSGLPLQFRGGSDRALQAQTQEGKTEEIKRPYQGTARKRERNVNRRYPAVRIGRSIPIKLKHRARTESKYVQFLNIEQA